MGDYAPVGSRLFLAVLCILVTTWQVGCGDSKTMSQAESDSREALRGMGAIAVPGPKGVHVGTLALTAPTILNKMDEAIPHVANLSYITHLEVTGTNLSDAHMDTIGGLKRLTSLVLSSTEITDEGLKQIAGRDIDTLYVDRTKIGPASMDVIGTMNDLSILDISASDVMSNLAPLSNLEELEWLIIDETEIDGAAIDIIKDLPKLGRFTIKGSTVSDADMKRLKSAKPSLMIDIAKQGEPAQESIQDTDQAP